MSLKLEDLDAISSITFNSEVTREIMVDALDFAILLNDDLISSWAYNELHGYPSDTGPNYRVLGPEMGLYLTPEVISSEFIPKEKSFVRDGLVSITKQDETDPASMVKLSVILAKTFTSLRSFLVSLYFAADKNSVISDSAINYIYEKCILESGPSDFSKIVDDSFVLRIYAYKDEIGNQLRKVYQDNGNDKFPIGDGFYKEFIGFGGMIDSYVKKPENNFSVIEGTLTMIQILKSEVSSAKLLGDEELDEQVRESSNKVISGIETALVRSYPEIEPILRNKS